MLPRKVKIGWAGVGWFRVKEWALIPHLSRQLTSISLLPHRFKVFAGVRHWPIKDTGEVGKGKVVGTIQLAAKGLQA